MHRLPLASAFALLALPASALDATYIGNWTMQGDDCTDVLMIGPNVIENNWDLHCTLDPLWRSGGEYKASADCSGAEVEFHFTVEGDTLTFLEGINFGDGFPSTWQRCPST